MLRYILPWKLLSQEFAGFNTGNWADEAGRTEERADWVDARSSIPRRTRSCIGISRGRRPPFGPYQNLYFVDPLWGLIDGQDPRAADALAERRAFYELYGFISRAGDTCLILPLIEEVLKNSEKTSADAMWILTGVAHRSGWDELLRLLSDGIDPIPSARHRRGAVGR